MACALVPAHDKVDNKKRKGKEEREKRKKNALYAVCTGVQHTARAHSKIDLAIKNKKESKRRNTKK
jgi:hypothetical protein